MGQVADDMVKGACCSICGVYFTNEHGYPVLCFHCKKKDPKSELPISRFSEF